MKNRLILLVIIISIVLLGGCARKFTVIPQMKDLEFTVVETYGDIAYTPIIDARSDFDKKGKVENSCSGGKSGVTHLGDKNYENELLPEFDNHLKAALNNSHLFSQIVTAEGSYTFGSSLDKFHVVLDEAKAQQTQACIGGILGAAIASSVDVTATTDIQLTGILTKDGEELWRHTVSKQIKNTDDYGKTRQNAENSMGGAIGETCKELITELAKYLVSE